MGCQAASAALFPYLPRQNSPSNFVNLLAILQDALVASIRDPTFKLFMQGKKTCGGQTAVACKTNNASTAPLVSRIATCIASTFSLSVLPRLPACLPACLPRMLQHRVCLLSRRSCKHPVHILC